MSTLRASLTAMKRDQLRDWARRIRGYTITKANGMTKAALLDRILELEAAREGQREDA